MLVHHDIRGTSLPAGAVCLTYDDGPGESPGDQPGPHSTAIGQFLRGEGIVATFFVVGRHVEQYPESVAELHRLGHRLGNHTYSHPGLVALADAGGDVVDEIARTDALIRKFQPDRRILVRPPYGSWRHDGRPATAADGCVSVVAQKLIDSGLFLHHIGPIKWDIVGEDWACWEQGLSVEDCTRQYVAAAEEAGRGIILLHDSCETESLQTRNRTLELTRRLVPALRKRGFRFVPLDDVPEIRTFA